MAQVVRFEGDDGAFMLVDMAVHDVDIELVADETGRTKALTRLEQSMESVQGAGIALLNTVRNLEERSESVRLDEVTLELGLSFSVEGGMIVAKGTGRAEASVTLTWRRSKLD